MWRAWRFKPIQPIQNGTALDLDPLQIAIWIWKMHSAPCPGAASVTAFGCLRRRRFKAKTQLHTRCKSREAIAALPEIQIRSASLRPPIKRTQRCAINPPARLGISAGLMYLLKLKLQPQAQSEYAIRPNANDLKKKKTLQLKQLALAPSPPKRFHVTPSLSNSSYLPSCPGYSQNDNLRGNLKGPQKPEPGTRRRGFERLVKR